MSKNNVVKKTAGRLTLQQTKPKPENKTNQLGDIRGTTASLCSYKRQFHTLAVKKKNCDFNAEKQKHDSQSGEIAHL